MGLLIRVLILVLMVVQVFIPVITIASTVLQAMIIFSAEWETIMWTVDRVMT